MLHYNSRSMHADAVAHVGPVCSARTFVQPSVRMQKHRQAGGKNPQKGNVTVLEMCYS